MDTKGKLSTGIDNGIIAEILYCPYCKSRTVNPNFLMREERIALALCAGCGTWVVV